MMDGIKLFWFSLILVSMTTAGVHSNPVDNGRRKITKLEFVGKTNKSMPIRTRAAYPGDVIITGEVNNQVIYNVDKPSFDCQDGERNCIDTDPGSNGPHPWPNKSLKGPGEGDNPFFQPTKPTNPDRPHPIIIDPTRPEKPGKPPLFTPNPTSIPIHSHPLPDKPSYPGKNDPPYGPINPIVKPEYTHPLPTNIKTPPRCDPMNCIGTCCQATNANGMEGGILNSGNVDSQFILNLDNKVSPQFNIYFEPYNGSDKKSGRDADFHSRSLYENTDQEFPKPAMPVALAKTDIPTYIKTFTSIETPEPTITIETSEPTVTTEIPEPVKPTENPKQVISSNKNKTKPEKPLKPNRAKVPKPVIPTEVPEQYGRSSPHTTRTERPLSRRLHKPNTMKQPSKKKAQKLYIPIQRKSLRINNEQTELTCDPS